MTRTNECMSNCVITSHVSAMVLFKHSEFPVIQISLSETRIYVTAPLVHQHQAPRARCRSHDAYPVGHIQRVVTAVRCT